jgi:signal transduction histidine kinase
MARKLAFLLLAVVVPPAITLAWLGLRLLEHDRAMLAQRELERQQSALQSAARILEHSLAAAERTLLTNATISGTVRLIATPAGVEAQPANGVLWLPVPPPAKPAATTWFAEGERFEFHDNPSRALDLYEGLERSLDRSVKAGALLRQARIHRRRRDWSSALGAYRRLSNITDINIDGTPADLLARRAIGSVLRESGNRPELDQHALALESDLFAGWWQIDRASWQLAIDDVEEWTGKRHADDERQRMSIVADALWAERQHDSSPSSISGRRLIAVNGTSITVVERRTELETTWIAIPPPVIAGWLDGHAAASDFTLLGNTDEVILGEARGRHHSSTLRASETGLPWTLAIAPRSEAERALEFATRRRLISIGVGAILLMLAGTSFFLWRVVQRDLAIARLQTDFVSAVSHEFRTPLSSLRHVSELLDENDDVPPERRRALYAALGRNIARLQQLVESLLDFARMEGRRKTYDLQPVDAGELTSRVVADFQQAAPKDFTIAFHKEVSGGLETDADPPSLTNALWNLLDNAVKYSGNGRAVHVSVCRQPHGIVIEVRDEGLGIPRHEQHEIFDKFVRGGQARALGIKGTGLGLALVAHIVRAHSGTIEIESEAGAGSTFRIVLPASTHSAQSGHYVHA